jgi:hypothetical protein
LLRSGQRGLRSTATGVTKELILKELDRVKWVLWHGNVLRANDTLSSLIDEVDGVREEDREAGRPSLLVLKKLSRAREECATYTPTAPRRNAQLLPSRRRLTNVDSFFWTIRANSQR